METRKPTTGRLVLRTIGDNKVETRVLQSGAAFRQLQNTKKEYIRLGYKKEDLIITY
jgi:hypothetical protein